MNLRRNFASLVRYTLVVGLLAISATVFADVNDQREEVRAQSRDALSRLYKAIPSAKGAVGRAAGYATFDNFAMKLGLAGGGRGKGLAVSNATKKETFMKLVEVQAGLGIGIKKYALIFVFDTNEALDKFIDQGWESSTQATAAAKHGDKGTAFAGAVSVSPGVWLYQLTKSGLAAEITLKGSKYYKDDELN